MEHEEHMERFRRFLDEQGLKLTAQRRAIADVFFRTDEHLSLVDLLELAREQRSSIGYATVYRTMKLMADSGLAAEHKFGEGEAVYEPVVEGEHHDHLICVRCGKIVEFEDDEIERRQEEVARTLGFSLVSHRHEIYGECTDPTCPPDTAGESAG